MLLYKSTDIRISKANNKSSTTHTIAKNDRTQNPLVANIFNLYTNKSIWLLYFIFFTCNQGLRIDNQHFIVVTT